MRSRSTPSADAVTIGALLLVGCGPEPIGTPWSSTTDPTVDRPGTDTGGEADTDADSDADDTGPPGTTINRITFDYDENHWVYVVELLGWGSGGNLDIYQNEGGFIWEESHVLELIYTVPHHDGDKWGIDLPIVEHWTDQVDGVNTLFAGTEAVEATLTWLATVYDLDGSFADCAVWGKRIEHYASFGCWEAVF